MAPWRCEENIPFRFLLHTPGTPLDMQIKGICATEDLRYLAPPDVPSNEGLTVLDYLLTTYKADHFVIDPLTMQQYASTVRRLDEWHNKPFLMQDLSTEIVSGWMAWLLNVKKLSPVTVNSRSPRSSHHLGRCLLERTGPAPSRPTQPEGENPKTPRTPADPRNLDDGGTDQAF